MLSGAVSADMTKRNDLASLPPAPAIVTFRLEAKASKCAGNSALIHSSEFGVFHFEALAASDLFNSALGNSGLSNAGRVNPSADDVFPFVGDEARGLLWVDMLGLEFSIRPICFTGAESEDCLGEQLVAVGVEQSNRNPVRSWVFPSLAN